MVGEVRCFTVVRELSVLVCVVVFCFAVVLPRDDVLVLVETDELSRLCVPRVFSAANATPVPNTDRARHTTKNGIILFIP